jgi:hypothetical protein
MSCPDDKGQVEIPADVQGEAKVRIDGSFLNDALRACGGMVELKLVDSTKPVLFTSPDYELVVVPMVTGESQKPKAETETAKTTNKSEVEKPTDEDTEAKAQAVAEAEAIAKGSNKPKRKHKVKEPVTV